MFVSQAFLHTSRSLRSMTAMTSDSMASATVASTTTQPDTFLKICLLWTVMHRITPPVCKDLINEENLMGLNASSKEELHKIVESIRKNGGASAFTPGSDIQLDDFNDHVKYQVRYTSRTLSVIG